MHRVKPHNDKQKQLLGGKKQSLESYKSTVPRVRAVSQTVPSLHEAVNHLHSHHSE